MNTEQAIETYNAENKERKGIERRLNKAIQNLETQYTKDCATLAKAADGVLLYNGATVMRRVTNFTEMVGALKIVRNAPSELPKMKLRLERKVLHEFKFEGDFNRSSWGVTRDMLNILDDIL